MKTLTEEQGRKVIEVITNVQTMRGLQRKYFKDRLSIDLQRSKQWEARVDREIEALLKMLTDNPIVEQGKLL